MRRWLSGLVLLLIASCLCAPTVDAQQSASSGIVGQVLDSSKSGIPGATVTVTHTGTNAQRVVTTDAEGRFAVPGLPPATYRIRVEISSSNFPRFDRNPNTGTLVADERQQQTALQTVHHGRQFPSYVLLPVVP